MAYPGYAETMKVGVPSEIKNNEFRVAITPAGVHELTSHGHEVTVQSGAGLGSSRLPYCLSSSSKFGITRSIAVAELSSMASTSSPDWRVR